MRKKLDMTVIEISIGVFELINDSKREKTHFLFYKTETKCESFNKSESKKIILFSFIKVVTY